MKKVFLLTSFLFMTFVEATELNQLLSLLEKNSVIIQSEKHNVESKRFKMLESKEKRYFNPLFNTTLSRQDGMNSLSARVSNTIYNSGKDNNQYLKDQTLHEISKLDSKLANLSVREELIGNYVNLLKKVELSTLLSYASNQTERAINKLRQSTKLKVTSQLSYEEAQIDFDEIKFNYSENLNEIKLLKSSIMFMTNDSKIDLENLDKPISNRFVLNDYKKVLTEIIEDGSNPLIKKQNLLINVGELDRNIGLSNYNLNAIASAGGQYFKNELAKDSDWKGAWLLSIGATYPILGYKSKKYYLKAFQHKKKSDEALRQHHVYQLSLDVLTKLEELDLLYQLHSRLQLNIDSLKKFWKERDLLYFDTSISNFKQFYSLLRSEISVKQNEIDIRYSIMDKELAIGEYLKKN